jgi:hypothetical protein
MNAPEPLQRLFQSRGLVSLLDMIRAYALEMHLLVEAVRKSEQFLLSHEGLSDEQIPSVEEAKRLGLPSETISKINSVSLKRSNFDNELNSLLDSLLRSIPHLVNDFNMHSSLDQLHRIMQSRNHGAKPSDLALLLRELANRIRDDLKRIWFCHVKSELVGYYGQKSAFGDAVSDRFPNAIDDIEAAGNCLALGQGTATVLHLMRIMEVGLKALGKALGIPYAPSWDSYLKQIQDRIAAKHRTKGVRWRKDEPFFRDLSGDLLTVKQAWRNPTMHVIRKYSPEEAEEIFRAVRTFMQRLAEKLPAAKIRR